MISIHAPRERSDPLSPERIQDIDIFQSTLLVRGATVLASAFNMSKTISIHAPRERSDARALLYTT